MKKDEWDSIIYPTLTDEENELIRTARRSGMCVFYPAYPDGETQDKYTLQAAKQYLQEINGEIVGG